MANDCYWPVIHVILVFLIEKLNSLDTKRPEPCVDLPEAPLYGKLELSGIFMVKLGCDRPGLDLPLNSPGEDGVLYCSSTSTNLQFSSLRLPKCLPRRPAKSIAMALEVRLTSTSDRCPSYFEVTKMTDQLLSFVQIKVKDAPSDLCPGCSIRIQRRGLCQKRRGSSKTQISLMLDVVTNYIEDLRSQYPRARKGLSELLNNHKSALPAIVSQTYSSSLNFIDLREWMAQCDRAVAEGMPLEVTGTPSCRGCQKNFYKMLNVSTCVPCNYGYYTEAAYASTCQECPRENLSGELKKDCFTRSLP